MCSQRLSAVTIPSTKERERKMKGRKTSLAIIRSCCGNGESTLNQHHHHTHSCGSREATGLSSASLHGDTRLKNLQLFPQTLNHSAHTCVGVHLNWKAHREQAWKCHNCYAVTSLYRNCSIKFDRNIPGCRQGSVWGLTCGCQAMIRGDASRKKKVKESDHETQTWAINNSFEVCLQKISSQCLGSFLRQVDMKL